MSHPTEPNRTYVYVCPVRDPNDADDCLPNYIVERVSGERQVYPFLVDAEAAIKSQGLTVVDWSAMQRARGVKWPHIQYEKPDWEMD